MTTTTFLILFYLLGIILILPISKKFWAWFGVNFNRAQGGYQKYDSSFIYAIGVTLIILFGFLMLIAAASHELSF